MKSSKYIDIAALCQIIGTIFTNPDILEYDDKYKFNKEDFCDGFHQTIFSSIYNIWQLGAKEITIPAIEDYLATRPKQEAEYKTHNGAEYLLKCAENSNRQTFDYYYNRMKKLSLLRAYEGAGMDLKWIYNPDTLNIKEKEQQEDWFDNASLETIAKAIDNKIEEIKVTYADGCDYNITDLGSSIDELLEELEQHPDLGIPLYGKYINTVTRGARLGRFYLRSAATNVGKTRAMVGDACYIGCSQMYDTTQNKWISIGACQPTMFIATEQSQKEIEQMALAFISGVEENHIAMNEYFVGEKERVIKAAQIIKNSKIKFYEIPDFTLSDIENIIKKSIRDSGTKFIFFDYIHTSIGILAEVSHATGGVKLREDNILFMMSVKLKEICTKYGVFIMSSTQLNADWKEAELPDQNLLRGAKAIADKIDFGCILLDVTAKDLESIKPFCTKNNLPVPNVKMSIYKNRANEHKSAYLWINANRGICRFDPLFMTNWRYEFKEIPDVKIKVEDESVF